MRSANGKPRGARDEHAMSFEDIGRELGVTAHGARWIFNQAMAKLRRKPQMQNLFLELNTLNQRSESRYPRLQSEL